MSPAPAEVYDPYNQPPSFLKRHQAMVWALCVFIGTTVLTIVSFPPFRAPELAYAFAAPAIFWAYRGPSLKLFASTLLAAQVIAWTVILGWLHHVTWGGLLLLGPLIGVWVGAWYLAVWWTMPRMIGKPTFVRLIAMLGLAAVWVLVEWTRTWLLSGFPWLPLAASQWTMVSMLQVASYTGAGGVSFVIIAVNIAYAAYAHRLFHEGAKGLNKRSQEFFLALFLVLVCFSIHVQTAFNRGKFTEPLARVAFVQPYIPQSVKWDETKAPAVLETLQDLTLRAAATGPDLMLWPEAVTPYAVKGEPQMQAWTEELVKRAGVPLIMGSVAVEQRGTPDETWFNGAYLIDPERGLQPDGYAKRHLVPFGEYVPFRPLLGWLQRFTEVGEGDFQAGDSPSSLLVSIRTGVYAFAPLVCYEDIFPDLARKSALAGADVLTVVTNNAWYGEGGAAYQHAAHSVLRAVETRRPVLRSGNGGWSGWIDEYGNVRTELNRMPNGAVVTKPRARRDTDMKAATIYFRGTATVDVTRDRRWNGVPSFYTEHGDWFLLVCVGLVAAGYLGLKSSAPIVSRRRADADETASG